MEIFPAFISFLEQHQLTKDPNKAILIAVSGGVDSMVLCHLCHRAKLNFSIAHCNFQLRAEDSIQDALFVEAAAKSYGVPYYMRQFDTKTLAKTRKISIQMAARILRYDFFQELRAHYHLSYLATAHHWDDAVETILLNFIKGTGIRGFQGIRPIQNHTIRPLLFARKEDILRYAQKEKINWREDLSNKTIHYHRNFIRHEIIPRLHHINPSFKETTQQTYNNLSDTYAIYKYALQRVKTQYVLQNHNGITISMENVVHLPAAKTILYEILHPYGFHADQIVKLLNKYPCSGQVLHAKGYSLWTDRTRWIVSPRTTHRQPLPSPLPYSDSHHMANNSLFVTNIYHKKAYTIKPNPWVAALDYDLLKAPLAVRLWEKGDYFYPLGMQQRKKLSDFFIDMKVDRLTKSQTLVVTSQGEIVWIVGYRIDNRFRVTNHTQKVYEITFIPNQGVSDQQDLTAKIDT